MAWISPTTAWSALFLASVWLAVAKRRDSQREKRMVLLASSAVGLAAIVLSFPVPYSIALGVGVIAVVLSFVSSGGILLAHRTP